MGSNRMGIDSGMIHLLDLLNGGIDVWAFQIPLYETSTVPKVIHWQFVPCFDKFGEFYYVVIEAQIPERGDK